MVPRIAARVVTEIPWDVDTGTTVNDDEGVDVGSDDEGSMLEMEDGGADVDEEVSEVRAEVEDDDGRDDEMGETE